MPRLPPGCIVVIELSTMVLSVVAAILIGVYDPDEGVVVDPWRLDAAYLQGVVGYAPPTPAWAVRRNYR